MRAQFGESYEDYSAGERSGRAKPHRLAIPGTLLPKQTRGPGRLRHSLWRTLRIRGLASLRPMTLASIAVSPCGPIIKTSHNICISTIAREVQPELRLRSWVE